MYQTVQRYQLRRIIQIFIGDIFKNLTKILVCFPTSLGQVHQKIVAAVARRCTRHLALICRNKSKGLLYQRQYIGRCQVTLYNEIVAGEATHRSPIDYLVGPHRVVAKERSCQVFNSVYCTWTEHRFAVRLFHTYVKGCHHLATDNILARHIYSTLQANMVYCKTWNLFHNCVLLKFHQEATCYAE